MKEPTSDFCKPRSDKTTKWRCFTNEIEISCLNKRSELYQRESIFCCPSSILAKTKVTYSFHVDIAINIDVSLLSADVSNYQELLRSKEDECAELSAKMAEVLVEKDEIRMRFEEADGELFKLRAQHRDTLYMLGSKDDNVIEFHQARQV